MNIASTRFATHTRTWLLIAGLTALLIGIGALIGGMFLYAFVALAVALNVVGYWFSDRIALRASRAQPVEPGTSPELEAMVQDLAQRAQVPVPRLYTISSEQPNAFATGRNPEHAAVAVTDGLLLQLPPEGVKSVLAHEFGHIKNCDILDRRDGRRRGRGDRESPPVLAALRRRGRRWPARLDRTDRDHHLRAARGVAPAARGLTAARVPRRCDLRGASRPREPARGCARNARTPGADHPLDVNPATASLYVVNPLRRQGVATLFSTHPPIAERVRRLRALDVDLPLPLVA
jgi:heat shock protein HtpX